jgi:hypothetical protein
VRIDSRALDRVATATGDDAQRRQVAALLGSGRATWDLCAVLPRPNPTTTYAATV